jgi:hypothetical protein
MPRFWQLVEQGLSAAQGQRLDQQAVLVDQVGRGERAGQPATTPDDHVRAGLGLDGGDLGRELAPRDPGFGPAGLGIAERLREHDLWDVVHRRRVRVAGLRPVRRHLLVRDAAHEVGAGPADAVELPLLQFSALGDRDSRVLTVAADEAVQRHRHVQNDVSHDCLSLLVLVSLLCAGSLVVLADDV